MTRIRWLFEAWQLRMKDAVLTKHVNSIGKQSLESLRDIIIATLGLNLAPVQDGVDETEPGNPKPKYRWPKDGEFTPLIYAIAREDYVMSTMENVKTLIPQDTEPTPELAEEDLEFFDAVEADPTAFWRSEEMQNQLKSYVHIEEPPNPNEAAPPVPKKPVKKEWQPQLQSKVELDDFDLGDDE